MVLPLNYPTVILLSSHPYTAGRRLESPVSSLQWSHQTNLSVRMLCLLTWASETPTWKWLEVISVLNGLVICSRQTRSLWRNRSWKAEVTLRSCSYFVHLPEILSHWPFHHAMVTQGFDGESQDAADPCPTLISLDLPQHPTHPLVWPCVTVVMSSSVWCAVALCACLYRHPLWAVPSSCESSRALVYLLKSVSRDCGLFSYVCTKGGSWCGSSW